MVHSPYQTRSISCTDSHSSQPCCSVQIADSPQPQVYEIKQNLDNVPIRSVFSKIRASKVFVEKSICSRTLFYLPTFVSFLTRGAAWNADAVHRDENYVCPSVRPSVKRVNCDKKKFKKQSRFLYHAKDHLAYFSEKNGWSEETPST